jgi:hypothetical protein
LYGVELETEAAIDGRRGVMPAGRFDAAKLGRPDIDGLEDARDEDGVTGAEG